MKKGMIVCVSGPAPETWCMEDEKAFRDVFSDFDAIRVITPDILPYQLHQNWLSLLSSGITHVEFTMAAFEDSNKLVFNGQSYVLPFIGTN